MAKTSKPKATTSARKRMSAAAASAGNRPRKKGRIKEYFKGVRLEMKKVVWPTKKEMGSFTAVVLVTCAAFALVFWAVDSGVLAAIKAVCF
ncbi:MAG: preprotein translocase subunit SecE [Anaerovoracaceae bacterium]|nr:preprotein translocase subunit SecE [Anaerovoracaceae bacterium]